MDRPSTLLIERHDRIVTIALNRPDDAHGINHAMAAELAQAAAACDADAAVKAVVLTASGRFFCAGGDVKAMAGFGEQIGPQIKRLADDLHRAIAAFARMDAPLIVAVNGVAAGAGVSLAACGDLVLASEAASFTMAYSGVGLSPDGSASHVLPRLIGLRRTQELMLTNRKLGAQEAAQWGLVTRVVAPDALMSETMALAHSMAAGSKASHAAIKTLLLHSHGNGLETQMELEARCIAHCATGPDGREGIAAFTQKRKPKFA